jgi:hypothetical protein
MGKQADEIAELKYGFDLFEKAALNQRSSSSNAHLSDDKI